MIGQRATWDRMMQMVSEGRLPHAILLCGPEGCGKMALAMEFASYLITESSQNKENAKAMLNKWQHPDLHFTFPVIRPSGTSSEHKMVSDDFAQEWNQLVCDTQYFNMDMWLERMNAANQQAQIGVGESDALTRKLALKSSQGGYKVSIIWLPERMNEECANKMLKLIEEPPTQTVFLMVCQQPEMLLETILSRTQRIDMKRIDTADIEEALITQRAIDPEAAHRLARASHGSWLRALDELDADNDKKQYLEMFIQLMRLAYQRNVKELKHWSDTMAQMGRERQRNMLLYFEELVRENFMYNFHRPELNYMTQEEENFARNFARFINEANVIEISELLQRCRRDIRQNANAKMTFFDMALQIIVLLIKK